MERADHNDFEHSIATRRWCKFEWLWFPMAVAEVLLSYLLSSTAYSSPECYPRAVVSRLAISTQKSSLCVLTFLWWHCFAIHCLNGGLPALHRSFI